MEGGLGEEVGVGVGDDVEELDTDGDLGLTVVSDLIFLAIREHSLALP